MPGFPFSYPICEKGMKWTAKNFGIRKSTLENLEHSKCFSVRVTPVPIVANILIVVTQACYLHCKLFRNCSKEADLVKIFFANHRIISHINDSIRYDGCRSTWKIPDSDIVVWGHFNMNRKLPIFNSSLGYIKSVKTTFVELAWKFCTVVFWKDGAQERSLTVFSQ